MPDTPPISPRRDQAPPGCVHVRCAECFAILLVGPGMSQFICPKCQLAQRLPPEMLPLLGLLPGERPRPQGIDPTKLQLPCASCKAILNVPHGLTRFKCPQCDSDLSMEGFPGRDQLQLPPPPIPPVPRMRPVGVPLPLPDVPLTEPEEINEVGSDNEEGCVHSK
jgi:LSD1 subclass zinc finger protein